MDNELKKEILEQCKNISREVIIRESERNGEKPFGYIIDWIKDDYNLHKIDAYPYAEMVMKYFGFE